MKKWILQKDNHQRWLTMALGCVLLFFTQATVSAKTLLEQYLHCDGFEEFVYHVEVPGNTNQNFHFCGCYQNGNYLLIRSGQKMDKIPATLKTDSSSLFTSIHFDRTWHVVHTDFLGYDRKIWEDKGIAEEEGNDVKKECLGDLGSLTETLLNYGLGHSAGSDLELDHGIYTNEYSKAIVDYSVEEKTKTGMPKVILAHFKDLEGVISNATWKRTIEYTTNKQGLEIPQTISCLVVRENGTEKLKKTIVIDTLISASGSLAGERFFRPGFEGPEFNEYGYPTTYNVQSNQLVGIDSKSNEVVRLKADDPRWLEEVDRKKLVIGYWIVAALIASLAAIFFVWRRKKK